MVHVPNGDTSFSLQNAHAYVASDDYSSEIRH